MSGPTLTSQVVDTSTGSPVVQLLTELYKNHDDTWLSWCSAKSSEDGMIQFSFTTNVLSAGTYKLKFNVADYFTDFEKKTLYPWVEIVFKVKESKHYHIPLLLSPYGYSTY